MSVDFDLFVVGGGPAGLATAIAAAGQGFSVAVADAWGRASTRPAAKVSCPTLSRR